MRTEQLRQALLKKKLSDNFIELPELEPSSDSDTEEEEDEEDQ